MPTRVLGIDPGLTRCGVGLIEAGSAREISLISVETISTDSKSELADRIGHIATRIENLITSSKPDAIAIERVFAQQNLRSVMGVAQVSGVVLMLASKHSIPVFMHTPSEVKAAVTGSGRANKVQVGNMVARILGLKAIPKPADSADSLAIAICHAWKSAGGTVSESKEMTAAQKKWQQAEQAATAAKRR
jgi:crossover junction endodeoxyribonuclease RuvC